MSDVESKRNYTEWQDYWNITSELLYYTYVLNNQLVIYQFNIY